MSAQHTILNPANEEAVAKVTYVTVEETDAAVIRAHRALESWRRVTPQDRARLLRRFADRVDAEIDALAIIEVLNAGHTIGNAHWEASNVRDVLHYYAGGVERHSGKQIPVDGGVDLTVYEPIGVVGIIVPWNFPMPIAAWGFAPALAAGNTVLLKPAEQTPLSALRLGELALEAGIPDDVFQVLPGRGEEIGWRLVTHPLVRKICFTGSSAVGKRIMAGCAEQVKRVTLELGGKSANIIFDDADVLQAARSAPSAVFDNAGQDCCARSRLLVHDAIFDEFMEHFKDAVANFVVGDPLDVHTEMGPLISSRQRERVVAFVNESDVLFEGSAPRGPGYWFAPTVLDGTNHNSSSFTEEIFGPVVSVTRFSDETDAVAIANDSTYGLSGSIWTRNGARALRVARALETGAISVNSNSSVRYHTPFGGFKQSGLGRELGPDALRAFSEEKNIFIATEE